MREPTNWYRPPFPVENSPFPVENVAGSSSGRSGWCATPGAAVIFDLDGVISDASNRQHFLRDDRWDWRGFFMAAANDPPIPTGLALVTSAASASSRGTGPAVIICTARPHYVLDITQRWLVNQGACPDLLILRPPGDFTSSEDFKRFELSRLRDAGYKIKLAIDDDERIIAMYRAENVFAMYVHSGYYER